MSNPLRTRNYLNVILQYFEKDLDDESKWLATRKQKNPPLNLITSISPSSYDKLNCYAIPKSQFVRHTILNKASKRGTLKPF